MKKLLEAGGAMDSSSFAHAIVWFFPGLVNGFLHPLEREEERSKSFSEFVGSRSCYEKQVRSEQRCV